ncbi:MAG: hypothetical protein LBE72_00795 [Rickettsia sp.]|nr:hypothetical protein [Rickettsia sp.]
MEPTAGQTQKAAAVVTPKGQGEDRGALLDEIRTGIQLKKVAPTTDHPVPPPPSPSGSDHDKATVVTAKGQGNERGDLFAEIRRIGKLREEKKLSESGENKALEELEKKQRTPPTRSPSPLGADFDKTIEKRYQAFHDDEDDEPEHADLVKLIEEKIVDENTLKTLINKAGVKNDKELIELINDNDIWDDDDRERKRDEVIKQLEKIKSNPVANVDMTKGQFPPKLQSAAKAIGENLPMTPKDGYKTLPPTPSPKLVGIKKEPSSREV